MDVFRKPDDKPDAPMLSRRRFLIASESFAPNAREFPDMHNRTREREKPMNGSKRNDITRRQLLGAVAAMGIATIGSGLLAGCSSSRTAGSASSAASSSAVSSAASTSASASSASASASTQATSKALVAVYSWSGNTLSVANRVAEDLHADLFRIEPTTPYTSNYDEMLKIAQDEQAAGTLPEIAGDVSGWDGYSTIYLGFPTWWGHIPQIVKSFLAKHDCAGKTIYPFNTHGGSGFASCLSDLSQACPQANVREGLSIMGDSVASNMSQIDAWVAKSA